MLKRGRQFKACPAAVFVGDKFFSGIGDYFRVYICCNRYKINCLK